MVARNETYKANDDIITGWQFVATLDDRTSIECQALDGREFKLGEGPEPPIHHNCRSTTVPVLHPDFAGLEKGAERIAKGEKGTEVIPADMTYYEWLKTQSPEFQDSVLGKTRGELLRSGELTSERFATLNLNKNFEARTLAEMRALEDADFKRAFDWIDSPDRLIEKSKAIEDMLNDYSDRESKWSGKTVIDDVRCAQKGANGIKEWNCDITLKSTASDKTIIHEHLHARSVSLYGEEEAKRLYSKHSAMEEGAVELYSREICKAKGISVPNKSYRKYVDALRGINSDLGLFDNDFDFAKNLFDIDMTKRYIYLEGEIDSYLSANKISADSPIAEALRFQLGLLYGGIRK